MTNTEAYQWLKDRVFHEELNKSQKNKIKEIAKEYLTYTTTREACCGDIYDTAFFTINSPTVYGLIPVQHTRKFRKIGEPKYKSANCFTPLVVTPDRCETATLIITEGFSKAVACSLVGFQALAIPGVTMFQNQIEDYVALGDWEKILIVFDSSIEKNPGVDSARYALAKKINANEVIWECKDHKGLDDVLKHEGVYALRKILNQDTSEIKDTEIKTGCSVNDIAKELVLFTDPHKIAGSYAAIINGKSRTLRLGDYLSVLSNLSELYTYFNKKLSIVEPQIKPQAKRFFKEKVKDLLVDVQEYNPINSRVFFDSDEVNHYQSQVSYSPIQDVAILEIFLDYLNKSVLNPDMFRTFCRRLLVEPGKIEQESLCFFTFEGASNTGKSTLLRIAKNLVGDQSGKFSASSLTDETKAGHLDWKRLMYDDDLGGGQLSKDTIKQVLHIVDDSFLLRRLYCPAEEYRYRGVIALNNTVPIKSDTASGLSRRNKAIKTVRNPNYLEFCKLPTGLVSSVVAAWALDMLEEDYQTNMCTNLVDGSSQSTIATFVNDCLDYHDTTVTPIREAYCMYKLLWPKKYTSLSTFETEVIEIIGKENLLRTDGNNEKCFAGYSRTIGRPSFADQVVKGGNYLSYN